LHSFLFFSIVFSLSSIVFYFALFSYQVLEEARECCVGDAPCNEIFSTGFASCGARIALDTITAAHQTNGKAFISSSDDFCPSCEEP
jgi:hypothetical protein